MKWVHIKWKLIFVHYNSNKRSLIHIELQKKMLLKNRHENIIIKHRNMNKIPIHKQRFILMIKKSINKINVRSLTRFNYIHKND